MDYKVFPLTKRLHKKAYDAILPTQPSLSQAGKTVLITGGGSGIGFAIAKAFAAAKAKTVIIVGRDQARLDASIKALGLENENGRAETRFRGEVCQLSNVRDIELLWNNLQADDISVDVLVLNAVMGGNGKMQEQGWEKIWQQFEVNVRSLHHFSDRFEQQTLPPHARRYLINVSSAAIHERELTADLPSYVLTKLSATLLMQQLAREKDPSQTQIISFHPGAVLTPSIMETGFDETTLDWDNANLPGSFAVWCATPQAAFLHGRFVWSGWDVDELAGGELRKKIEEDEKFLRIGVHGL